MEAFAERARVELRATGEHARTRSVETSNQLTPQEAQIAQMVLDGTLPAASARWFIQRSGARFLLADCKARPDLDEVLAPLAESSEHFGCAAVYTLNWLTASGTACSGSSAIASSVQ